MSFEPSIFILLPLIGYLVVGVVASVLAYLVIRFAVRDGLRGHTRWLESRSRTADPDARPPR